MQAELKKKLLDATTEPYRPTGRFNYQWARGKLGRGLLAAWMLGAERFAERGKWNAPHPAKGLRSRGIELMEREAVCGNQALQPLHDDRVQLSGGDMREADLDDTDAIAILDVLHYIPYAEQDRLLDRIRTALGTGGLFVTRVGNAGSGRCFTFSQWVDACMSFAQGHRLSCMCCRPLEARGFVIKSIPMSAGTPFANVMLVARIA